MRTNTIKIGILGSAAVLATCVACDRSPRRDVDSARPGVLPGTPAAAAGGAAVQNSEPARAAEPAGTRRAAEADFEPAAGSKLDGDAELEEIDTGVRITVEVEQAPKGTKAIHVHEKGDCSDVKNQSMGSHFNPAAKPHGLPHSAERHAGDLGNIVIGEDGKGRLEIVVPNVNLKPDDPMSILNRALIIHQGEDIGAQPSGGAGAPMACAVIRKD